jgi:exonuclease V gamma subunit
MGQIELDAMSREADAFANRIRSLHGTRTLRVEIRRERYVLVGQIDSLGPFGALRWRPSDRKPADMLLGYIEHCVRQLAETSEPMRALPTIVVGKDGESRWASLEDAEAQLDAIVDAYLQGLTSPPPVPPLAGWAFAYRMCKPKRNSVDPELEALDDARKAYFEGNQYDTAPHDLPNECMTLCFGQNDPTRRGAFVEQAKAIHVKAFESMQEQQQ